MKEAVIGIICGVVSGLVFPWDEYGWKVSIFISVVTTISMIHIFNRGTP